MIVYDAYISTFEGVLEKDKSFNVHRYNADALYRMTKIY